MNSAVDIWNDLIDAVVIGGGAAGLNGALMLGRSRRSVVIVDAGEPRNAPAAGVHGFLTRDGIAPAELVRLGQEEARSYGAETVVGRVTDVERHEGHFAVTLDDGRTLKARRLLVTTGLVDRLPEVEGLSERWGRDVVHCPYCHGWEVRDRAIGIIAVGPMSMHSALLFRQLSDDLVYFVNDTDLDDHQRAQLAALDVETIDGRVTSIGVEDDQLTAVNLDDGRTVPRQVVAVGTRMEARGDFLGSIGLAPVEHPSGVGEYVPSDATGRTELPGVWVAGNITDLTAQVGASAAAGALAGAHINADLVMEDARLALERYQQP